MFANRKVSGLDLRLTSIIRKRCSSSTNHFPVLESPKKKVHFILGSVYCGTVFETRSND